MMIGSRVSKALAGACLCATLASCGGCASEAPATSAARASWKDYRVVDFNSAHSRVGDDANEGLILGALPISDPAPGLAPELAAFLGRWEGYDYSPPVKKDLKVVLVVQDISPEGGKAVLWECYNLQYPFWVKEIRFRVIPGATPSIEWRGDLAGGPGGVSGTGVFSFRVDPSDGSLEGGFISAKRVVLKDGTKLTRDRSLFVYEDYVRYLAGKRISAKDFRDADLRKYGAGYMLYLPAGYEADKAKAWPLILFFHGSGDKGDDLLLLAKASPLMYIREKGDLPCIIAAPILKKEYSYFPEEYMSGALKEIEASYRVDPNRVTVTGLSLGGEATYRFAIARPNAFAAIAPLAAVLGADQVRLIGAIKDLPVWAIHGADDDVIPLANGRIPVDALAKAGGKVRFAVLRGHDHDVWTDTYSDPAFYDWLLVQHRP